MDNIAIGISVISPKMEILWMNRTFKEWFPSIDLGKKPLCYRSFYSPPKKRICDYCPTIRVFRDGQVHSSETGVCADGNFYLVTTAPLKNERGVVTAVIETVQNITELKKIEEGLRESEEKYRSLIEATDDIVFALDREGKFTFGSAKAIEKFGDLKGKPFTVPVLPEYHALVKKNFARRLKGEKIEPYPIEVIDKEGNRFWAEISGSPLVKDGQIVGAVYFEKDITERKKAEDALRERLKELERMHRAFVGRELRMKELKEEIEKLKERLGER